MAQNCARRIWRRPGLSGSTRFRRPRRHLLAVKARRLAGLSRGSILV